MRLVPLLLLSALLVACHPSPPAGDPAPPDTGSVTKPVAAQAAFGHALAAGDTLAYILTLNSFGARATGAQFTVFASQAGWTRPVRQPMITLSLPFTLINATAWDTVTFKLYAWGTNGAKVSKDSSLLATWRVVRSPSAPPGGSIDSSQVIAWQIWPDDARTPTAATTQFCVVVMLGDLKWHLSNDPSSGSVIECSPALNDPRYRTAGALFRHQPRYDVVPALAFNSFTVTPRFDRGAS